MRIGIVLSNPPRYSETFFVNKIKFLKEAGFQVFLFVDRYTPETIEKCIVGYSQGNGFFRDLKPKIIVGFRILFSPCKILKLYIENKNSDFTLKQNIESILKSSHILNYELDWLHFGFATMAINRENVSKTIGAKMAVSIRGYDISIYPLKKPNCYDLLWKRIDKLHYISNDLLNIALENGFPRTKLHFKITPAIDTEKFIFKEHTLNEKLRITTIARLHWKKGLEYTLEALSYLKQKGVFFEYSIIGEGEEYERLKFAAYQFGIMDHVKFLGKKEQNEIIDALSETDIYIQYSIQEGFGNSVLEAQAMGCICIVSDAEGLSENVLDGVSGFVVKKREPELLFHKITEVIKIDDKTKNGMIEKGVYRLKNDFNLKIQKQRFIDFYQC
jgi:glycosyltransferase involved in cell wall biosynthesis